MDTTITGPDSPDRLIDVLADALHESILLGCASSHIRSRHRVALLFARRYQAKRDADRLLATEQIAAARQHVHETWLRWQSEPWDSDPDPGGPPPPNDDLPGPRDPIPSPYHD